MIENLIIWLFVALGFMSSIVFILSLWNLKLQDENDRLKIENVSNRSPC